MKRFMRVGGCAMGTVGVWCAVLLTGCHTHTYTEFNPTGSPANIRAVRIKTGEFQSGDLVTITFSGVEPLLPMHEEQIKGDGTITPPFVGPVIAAGKDPGQLQSDLQEKYGRIYTHITVTVRDKRVYYISGEVNHPGPTAYIGGTDLIQAISAAGGFTEYADKKNIQITRAGTRRQVTVNFKRAIDDPQNGVLIYPNDTINVPRSIW